MVLSTDPDTMKGEEGMEQMARIFPLWPRSMFSISELAALHTQRVAESEYDHAHCVKEFATIPATGVPPCAFQLSKSSYVSE
jgi:hypothetical protein